MAEISEISIEKDKRNLYRVFETIFEIFLTNFCLFYSENSEKSVSNEVNVCHDDRRGPAEKYEN